MSFVKSEVRLLFNIAVSILDLASAQPCRAEIWNLNSIRYYYLRGCLSSAQLSGNHYIVKGEWIAEFSTDWPPEMFSDNTSLSLEVDV